MYKSYIIIFSLLITHRIFALILPPFKESVCGFEILGKLAVYINKLENPLIYKM